MGEGYLFFQKRRKQKVLIAFPASDTPRPKNIRSFREGVWGHGQPPTVDLTLLSKGSPPVVLHSKAMPLTPADGEGYRAAGSLPVLAVEAAELDGLSDMLLGKDFASLHIGAGTGDLQNSVIGSCRESELIEHAFKHRRSLIGHRADLLNDIAGNASVTGNISTLKALGLDIPCSLNTLSDLGRAFLLAFGRKIRELHRSDLYVNIKSVEQRTADS